MSDKYHFTLQVQNKKRIIQIDYDFGVSYIISLFLRFERVLGPCSEILKRNIQQYNSYVSLSV